MFLEKCSKWNLNFQNWSKSLCLGVSEPTKRLALRVQQMPCVTDEVKQAFDKENENNEKKKSKSVKSLR